MVQIRVNSNTDRKEVFATVDQTVSGILEANNFTTVGAQLLINGDTASVSDLSKTLSQLGIADNSTAVFSITTKATAAR